MDTGPRGAAVATEHDYGGLKIMCWNINCLTPSVRNMELRHKSFRGFMDHFQLDLACFQEIKLPAARITRELACVEGFQSFWATSTSKPGYSGVTTWCRTATAAPHDAAVDCLGGDEQPELDTEGRLVLTDHGAFVLLNVYVPNAGDRPERARLPYKLAFLRALRAKMDELTALGRQVILVGDLNIALERSDVHPTLDFDSMYDERELAVLAGLTAAYPDVWRRLHPDTEGSYTVWDERTSARAFNVGLRIDFVLVSPGLLPYVQSCEILPAAEIPPKWSDHAAILLALRSQRMGPPTSWVPAGMQPLSASQQPTQAMNEAADGEDARQRQSLLAKKQPREAVVPGFSGNRPANDEPPFAAGNSGSSSGGGDGGVAFPMGAARGNDGGAVAAGTLMPSPPPRLPLPPPAAAPCALWRDLEARFVDKNQKSIRDIFGRRPPGVGTGAAPCRIAASPPTAPVPQTSGTPAVPEAGGLVDAVARGISAAAAAAPATVTGGGSARSSNGRKRAAAAECEEDTAAPARLAPALRMTQSGAGGTHAAADAGPGVQAEAAASGAQVQGLPGEPREDAPGPVPGGGIGAGTDENAASTRRAGGRTGEGGVAAGALEQQGDQLGPARDVIGGLGGKARDMQEGEEADLSAGVGGPGSDRRVATAIAATEQQASAGGTQRAAAQRAAAAMPQRQQGTGRPCARGRRGPGKAAGSGGSGVGAGTADATSAGRQKSIQSFFKSTS